MCGQGISILQYFKKTLPSAHETKIGEVATKETNQRVQSALARGELGPSSSGRRKRKAYAVYTDEDRARIGRFAAENNNASALKRFRGDFPDLSESTVRGFKSKYLAATKKMQTGEIVTSIPSQKRGRPLTLGELDGAVQEYIRALRKAGTPVSTEVILAAAEGIVVAQDRTLLQVHGGSIVLTRGWALSLMKRMGLVKRRGSTQGKKSVSSTEYQHLRSTYLHQISGIVAVHKIPPEMVVNWDQSGISIVPTCNWTMEQEGASRVEIAGLNDKRQITVTFAASLSGDLLPPQVLYQGKTERCHPSFTFPDGYDIWHSPNHWANGDTVVRYINNVILPYFRQVRAEKGLLDTQPGLCIYDVFKGHKKNEVQTLVEENKILTVFVPSNCTDLLQPLDLSVNKAVKERLRQHFRSWYSEQVKEKLQVGEEIENITVDLRMSVMKELGARWIVSACDHIRSHPEIITNGFKKAGIVEAIASPDNISSSNCNGDPTSGDMADQDSSDGDPFEDLDCTQNNLAEARILQ